MIKITKYAELTYAEKNTIAELIEEEFGEIQIVKETEWTEPDWTIIYYQENKIVSVYNIIEREILLDSSPIKALGINNVITPKEERGKGYSSKLLRETESLVFDQFKSKIGLLLCADAMLPFYERLNWYKINCPVYFDQSNGIKTWAANCMLLTQNERLHPLEINLNGLPW